jgi:hypothetical protein
LSSSVPAALIAAYNASLAAPPKLPKQSKAGGAVASAPASQTTAHCAFSMSSGRCS